MNLHRPFISEMRLMERSFATQYTPPPLRMPGVLVADDELEIRGIAELALRQTGFAVWLAVDGQHAVELFSSHHEAIDAALLDVNMPRLNGLQTLTTLQEIAPRIPCCFMSGALGEHTADQLRTLGARSFLSKPFTFGALIETVRSLVAGVVPTVSAAARHGDQMTTQPDRLDMHGMDKFGKTRPSGRGRKRDAREP
jgi:CheY-like chemotaxis protein